jgi:tetratricopeptide (TPR) repeat protein
MPVSLGRGFRSPIGSAAVPNLSNLILMFRLSSETTALALLHRDASRRQRAGGVSMLAALALVLPLVVPTAGAQQFAAGGTAPEDELAAGDRAYRERRDKAQAEAALRHYRIAYTRRPNDAQAAWRVGMAAYFMGQRHSPTPALEQRYYAEGRDAARRGSELDPKCAECFFWTGINMALYGQSVGVLKMLFTVGAVRRNLERSVALDPTYAFGGGHRVLGAIDRKLPGLLGGSKKRARAHFEVAIAASPDEPLNYLFLAQLLAEDLKDRAGAIAILQRALKVPPLAAERVEAIDCLDDVRDYLKHLGVSPESPAAEPGR